MTHDISGQNRNGLAGREKQQRRTINAQPITGQAISKEHSVQEDGEYGDETASSPPELIGPAHTRRLNDEVKEEVLKRVWLRMRDPQIHILLEDVL